MNLTVIIIKKQGLQLEAKEIGEEEKEGKERDIYKERARERKKRDR